MQVAATAGDDGAVEGGSASANSVPAMDTEAVLQAEWRQTLAAIEGERAALLAGKHAGFAEKCAVLDSKRVDEYAKAVLFKQQQERNVANLYEYHKYAADQICEVCAAPLARNAPPTVAPFRVCWTRALCAAARRVFFCVQDSKRKVRERMLSELEDKIKSLQDRMSGVSDTK
ncbi:hypothetical protein EON66_11715, partial [archaeon]